MSARVPVVPDTLACEGLLERQAGGGTAAWATITVRHRPERLAAAQPHRGPAHRIEDRVGGGPARPRRRSTFAGLVEEAIDALRPSLSGCDLDVVVQVAPNLPPVQGDTEQLERALVSVLPNAVKFTPDGARVTVMATAVGSEVEIGILEEEQQHLFDGFFRASTARAAVVGGTGLGLAIVKSVVDADGGGVSIESRPEAARGWTSRSRCSQRHDERRKAPDRGRAPTCG